MKANIHAFHGDLLQITHPLSARRREPRRREILISIACPVTITADGAESAEKRLASEISTISAVSFSLLVTGKLMPHPSKIAALGCRARCQLARHLAEDFTDASSAVNFMNISKEPAKHTEHANGERSH
jgi:hypothetical protein